jgi:hypothetical protein
MECIFYQLMKNRIQCLLKTKAFMYMNTLYSFRLIVCGVKEIND